MTDLRRMRQLMKRLPNILWDIERKEANATRITSTITGMPRAGGGKNREEEARILLIDAKDSYREALKELEQMREELEPKLLMLNDEERGVMRLRYIYGYNPEIIAKVIYAHPRTVYRRLKSAERNMMNFDK